MRICFVNTQKRWAGGERWFLWAAGAMKDRGHEVVLAAAEDSELARRTSDMGVSVELAGRMLGRSLKGIFRSHEPGVVLCNSGGEARSCVRARGKADRPKVVLRRGLCRDLGSGPVKSSYYRRLDGLFCNSRKTAEVLKEAHSWLRDREVPVLYNPVPELEPPALEDVDRLRSELSVSPDDFVVLSVGRLDEDKGHVFLVRALQRVLEDVPGVRLIIAGEGPERKNLEETARELQIDERIRLCGFVRNPAPLYELADVAVFPSLPGYESFCNAALEAMSFGLPVVATGCGGFPELIADGESGLLVPCGDAERIAEALLRLDRDEELRNRIGGAGRAVVMREFSPESRTEELESFLMRILEG